MTGPTARARAVLGAALAGGWLLSAMTAPAQTLVAIPAQSPVQVPEATKAPPPPFADFSFRRVKPPVAGAGRRITIQIAPQALPPAAEPAEAPPRKTAPRDQAEWFWSVVSADLQSASPARFGAALDVLAADSEGRRLPAPRLDLMERLARTHGAEILRATVGTRVSPALALSVMAVESAGQPGAISARGALGLMQLMPETAARFGVDATISAQNIRGGVAYLDWLIERFGGDALLALAGYNAGENAVARYGGVPPFAETRFYVPKVLAAWNVARALCMTPPELAGDGCVFVAGGRS